MISERLWWTLNCEAVVFAVLSLTAATSAAVLLVLALRASVRRVLGSAAAYLLWLLVPIAALGCLLPAKTELRAESVAPISSGAADYRESIATAVAMSPEPAFDPAPSLVAIWLVGSLVMSLQLTVRQRRFVRELGALSSAADGMLRAQVSTGCPALVGAWRPRIILPVDFEQRYSPDEQRLILLHEQRHRRCGDPQFNALVAAMRCAFWFNPLIHYATKSFRVDQELSCDAAVIAQVPHARRIYAEALLKSQIADCGLPVGCHWQFFPAQSSIHPLKERLVMLKHPTPRHARRALGLIVPGILALSAGYAAWAAQPVRIIVVDALAAQSPGSTSPASSPDAPLSLRRWHAPIYPQALIDAGVDGVIGVRAEVDASGSVIDAHVEFSAPASIAVLDGNALSSVYASNFAPAKVHGKAVAASTLVPIRFRIEGHPDVPMPPLPADAMPGDYVVFDAPSDPDSMRTETKPKGLDVGWPDYPDTAVRTRSAGRVVVKVHIDAKGIPPTAVIDSMDPADLGNAFAAPSIATAMQARYTPGTRNGQPVAGELLQQFLFRNGETAHSQE